MLTKYLLATLSILAADVLAIQTSDNIAPEFTTKIQKTTRHTAKDFIVAAAHPLAVRAGYEVLKKGGSAADTLVVVQTVLGLVEPQSSGLGGGAFVVYYDAKKGKLTTYDGRETAPFAATASLFQNKQGEPLKFFDAVVGGRSVATPATVKLLDHLHKKHGLKNWKSLLQPAITLASEGFSVSERMASSIKNDAARLARYPDTKAYFFHQGKPLKAGHKLVNKAYAKSLTLLANEGVQAFYQGQIAKDIVEKVQGVKDNPGHLSLKDFTDYQIIERKALCKAYRQYKVCGMGPPSSGALTLSQALGILEHFDLKALGAKSAIAWQLIGDASRLAFADRELYIADPDFIDLPKDLLDKAYLKKRASLIKKGQALKEVTAGNPEPNKTLAFAKGKSIELPSTTHIVIADKMGNIISMTSSIENGFGSRLMSNGFLLNNELTDFSFVDKKGDLQVANRLEPGKRPRSSMTPTIVFKDDKPYLAIGSPGGSSIIGYVLQSLIAHLDWGMDIQEAINMPRMLNRFGHFELEKNTQAKNFKPALEKMGYQVQIKDLNSGLQAVLFQDKQMIGAADPRREGMVLGD